MKHRLLAPLVLLAASVLWLPPLYGADIYRWVDQDGRVHLSDTVPEQFKKSATRIDAKAAAAPASAVSAEMGTADCATLRRRFAESNECFSPFFNRNGSVKAEGYAKCGTPVPYPARECSSARR